MEKIEQLNFESHGFYQAELRCERLYTRRADVSGLTYRACVFSQRLTSRIGGSRLDSQTFDLS